MASQTQARDQLRSEASRVADEVASTATQVTDSMKQTMLEQAGARLDGVAQQVNTVGAVLHQTAQQFRDKQQRVLASQAEQLASRAESISQHLRDSSPQDLLREAEDYTRSQPMLILGAAAIVGFTAARLFKIGGSRTMTAQGSTQFGAGAPRAGGRMPAVGPDARAAATTPAVRRVS